MPIAPDAEPFHADATPRSEDGQRIGVLLSHGFTGSPKSMRPWAEQDGVFPDDFYSTTNLETR